MPKELSRRSFLRRIGVGLVAFVPGLNALLHAKPAQAQACYQRCSTQVCYCTNCIETRDEGSGQYVSVTFNTCYDFYDNTYCSSPTFSYAGAVCDVVC